MSAPPDPSARGRPPPPDAGRELAIPERADAVFAAIPEIMEDMRARPGRESSFAFLDKLVDSPTPEEAVTFCAYLLPPRGSVGWGYRCLAPQTRTLTETDRSLLQLVENWLREPSEEARFDVLETASTIRPRSPAVWLGLGAGWSGGSISAPDLPPVPAPAFAAPRAVNASILSLLARAGARDREAALRQFVGLGRRIAAEWPAPGPHR